MSTFTQDLPPREGYRPFQIDRIPLRTIIGGKGAIALCLASTVIGHYFYYLGWKDEHRRQIEMRGSMFALYPILLAERDRAFLKQVKRNVVEEKELMRYYPSWKVGTYFGERIYKTIPEDQFIEPDAFEYYAHASENDYTKRQYLIETT